MKACPMRELCGALIRNTSEHRKIFRTKGNAGYGDSYTQSKMPADEQRDCKLFLLTIVLPKLNYALITNILAKKTSSGRLTSQQACLLHNRRLIRNFAGPNPTCCNTALAQSRPRVAIQGTHMKVTVMCVPCTAMHAYARVHQSRFLFHQPEEKRKNLAIHYSSILARYVFYRR